jgi:hypothetical protein
MSSFISNNSQSISTWNPIYDIDFSNQIQQDFKISGDGVYTIDSKQWNVINSNNSSTFNINSDGIGGTVTSGGLSLSTNSITCPSIYI